LQPEKSERRDSVLIHQDQPRLLGKERGNAMAVTIIEPERADEILTREVPDAALETAAGAGNEGVARYTLYFCTALDLCPGP
jgi:hypothetical protein